MSSINKKNVDTTNTTIMQIIYDNRNDIEKCALQNKSEFRNYINKIFKESLKDLTYE